MSKVARTTGTVGIAALIMGGMLAFAPAANAIEDETAVITYVVANESDNIDPAPFTFAPRGSDEMRSLLTELSHIQTQEEINQIFDSVVPAEFLWDPETNEFLAAVTVFDPYLSILGPGCSTTSACLRNTQNTPFGF